MLAVKVYRGSPSGRVEAATTYSRPPQGREVLVRITHSGLCGTDEHYIQQSMVLGHEGVGIVEAVGDSVGDLKIGNRVGWGYCHGSCRSCWACTKGEELYCDKRQLYGFTNLDQGSFASHAIRDEDFLFSIPVAMSSAAAAPMMCAGAAVYSALHRAGIRWSDRVGIYGLGGLGHMAVQFAAKMGCKVVVYSHSATKESEAYRLGATEFCDFSSATVTNQAPQAIDCLLLTRSQQPDWSRMIPIIRRGGTISAMTVDPTELRLPYMDLVMNAVQIQGSLPATPRLHREMLEVAAQHGIAPIIETFSFDEEGINMAMEKLRTGKMRYRGVIERIGTEAMMR